MCVCEKARQRWRVLHVHWQLYRLCGEGNKIMGKETRTYTDTLELAIVPDTIVRWGPRFSAHVINRDKLAPSKHTYNLLKWKAELLRVKRGWRGRVRRCNCLRGRPADPQGPERCTKTCLEFVFHALFQSELTAELYLLAPSLGHFSRWWKGFIPTR